MPQRGSPGHASDGAGSGSRGSSAPTASRVKEASRSISSSSSSTRSAASLLVVRIADRRQVDQHVRRRTAGGRLTEQGSDVEVARRVGVAPPGERLGDADQVDAGLHGPEGYFGGHDGRPTAWPMSERSRSSSVSRGSFIAAAYVAKAAASSSASDQEPVGQFRAGPCRPLEHLGVLGVLGAVRSTARRPSSRAPPPRDAPTADALPPPGTGAADARSATNRSRVRSRKRTAAMGPRPDCTVAGDRRPDAPDQRSSGASPSAAWAVQAKAEGEQESARTRSA